MGESSNGGKDTTWWWKAATTSLFGLLAMVLLKGCDQWNQTNTALTNLTSEVKYHTERIGQREERLKQVEQNLQLLYERTVARFDERRKEADALVNRIDERIDRLERGNR